METDRPRMMVSQYTQDGCTGTKIGTARTSRHACAGFHAPTSDRTRQQIEGRSERCSYTGRSRLTLQYSGTTFRVPGITGRCCQPDGRRGISIGRSGFKKNQPTGQLPRSLTMGRQAARQRGSMRQRQIDNIRIQGGVEQHGGITSIDQPLSIGVPRAGLRSR